MQHSTLGIQKAASTFERAMAGRVMHSIAFLTLCAAYIEGGLSKLSNIAASMAEMEEFHVGQYHPAMDSSAAAWCDRFPVIFIERDRFGAST